MNKVSVQSLNECFNVSGEDFIWIDDDCWEPIEDGWKGDWCYFQKGHKINVGRSTSELQKQRARENAIKRNVNQRGANNRNAKKWLIVYQDGRTITVKSIHSWARDNGYSKSGIRNLYKNKWNRYKDIASITQL